MIILTTRAVAEGSLAPSVISERAQKLRMRDLFFATLNICIRFCVKLVELRLIFIFIIGKNCNYLISYNNIFLLNHK